MQVQGFVCLVLVIEDAVLLLRKNRPEWQVGKLNFFGGKVEPGERPQQAAEREAEEELGPAFAAHVPGWRYVATENGPGYSCDFFFARVDRTAVGLSPEQNDVGEIFEWHPIPNLPREVIGNCRWIMQLCMDPRPGLTAEVTVAGDIAKAPNWGPNGRRGTIA